MTGRIDSIMSPGVTFIIITIPIECVATRNNTTAAQRQQRASEVSTIKELDEAADFHFTYFTDIWGATPEQDE